MHESIYSARINFTGDNYNTMDIYIKLRGYSSSELPSSWIARFMSLNLKRCVLLWFLTSWICSTDAPKGAECETLCQYPKCIVHKSTDLKKKLDGEYNLHYGLASLVVKKLNELARTVEEKMESINYRPVKTGMWSIFQRELYSHPAFSSMSTTWNKKIIMW